MTRIGLALRAAWRTLRDAAFAETVAAGLSGAPADETRPAAEPPPAPAPARSEALTLLAALQREARLLDFLMEPLDGYPDAQVGAAARDVHRDSARVIRRMFDPQPLRAEEEGRAVEVPAGYNAARIQLTGPATGEPPFRGTLRHPGWEAAACDLPVWNGKPDDTRILAPAEVDTR